MFMFCLMAKEQQVKPVSAARRQVRFSLPLELPASRVVHLYPRYRWCSLNKEGLSALGKGGLQISGEEAIMGGIIDFDLQSLHVWKARNKDTEIYQTGKIKQGYAILCSRKKDPRPGWSRPHHVGVNFENQIRRFCSQQDLRHLQQ